MFIILQIFFATSGISQSVICQHVKVCQLASKTASFNIHFQNSEQTSLQLKEYAWEKVQHFSERKTYFFNCVDTSGGYDLQTAYRQN